MGRAYRREPQKHARLVSALTLLVTKIRTHHADNAVPTNDLAVAANFLDGSTYFHGAISTTGYPAIQGWIDVQLDRTTPERPALLPLSDFKFCFFSRPSYW